MEVQLLFNLLAPTRQSALQHAVMRVVERRQPPLQTGRIWFLFGDKEQVALRPHFRYQHDRVERKKVEAHGCRGGCPVFQ